MVYYNEGINYYGEVGCCLICPDSSEGCLCSECKCRRCSHYIAGEDYDYNEDTGRVNGYCGFFTKRILIEIDAWLKETEKAYLVVIDGEDMWLPKSETSISSRDNEMSIWVPMWLAVEKGLAEYD